MMQQALRRFLTPASGLGSIQASSRIAAAEGAGFNFARSEDAGNGTAPCNASSAFHIPSLFSTLRSSDEQGSMQAPSTQFSTEQMLIARRRSAMGLSSPTGMLPFSARPFSALAAAQSSRMRPVKGLGLGLPARKSPAVDAVQARTYLTEGELLGAAYLTTTDIMFWSGLIGAVVFRRNLIVMLLCTEIVMLACNMNFLFAAAYLNDMTGVIMSITITTIAACETAIGLALCVTYFHIRSATDVEALNLLK